MIKIFCQWFQLIETKLYELVFISKNIQDNTDYFEIGGKTETETGLQLILTGGLTQVSKCLLKMSAV